MRRTPLALMAVLALIAASYLLQRRRAWSSWSCTTLDRMPNGFAPRRTSTKKGEPTAKRRLAEVASASSSRSRNSYEISVPTRGRPAHLCRIWL